MSEVNFKAVQQAIHHKCTMLQGRLGRGYAYVVYMDCGFYRDLLNCRGDDAHSTCAIDILHAHSEIVGCRVHVVTRPMGYDVERHPDFVVAPVIQ